jgi:uncharacterized protein
MESLLDISFLIFAGAVVGFIIGITGVGGGALMTPLLMIFGFPPTVAVGTDLWFAAITKTSGLFAHAKQDNINWAIVGLLAAGSLPASLITGHFLKTMMADANAYHQLLTTCLGIMLTLTAAVLFLRSFKKKNKDETQENLAITRKQAIITITSGVALGVFVTLSSVGAGAFGTAILMMVFPFLASNKIVGSDIAHAVPLTLSAGLVHLALGNVDWELLLALITGSVPAIMFGSRFTKRIPSHIMQPILACLLLAIGLNYTFFNSKHESEDIVPVTAEMIDISVSH